MAAVGVVGSVGVLGGIVAFVTVIGNILIPDCHLGCHDIWPVLFHGILQFALFWLQ
jgi:hypothetical protein